MDNRLLIYQMTEALSKGAPAGFVGAMDKTAIDTTTLEARLGHWKQVGWHTEHAKALVSAGAAILMLRRALRGSDEEELEKAIMDAEKLAVSWEGSLPGEGQSAAASGAGSDLL